MMDADNAIKVSENGAGYENGVHDQLLPILDEHVVMEKHNGDPAYNSDVEELVANFGDVTELNDVETSGFSAQQFTEGSTILAEGNALESSKVGFCASFWLV